VLIFGCASFESCVFADNGLHHADSAIGAQVVFKTGSSRVRSLQQRHFKRLPQQHRENPAYIVDWREQHNLKVLAAIKVHGNSSSSNQAAAHQGKLAQAALNDTSSLPKIKNEHGHRQTSFSHNANETLSVQQKEKTLSDTKNPVRQDDQSQDTELEAKPLAWPVDWGIEVESERSGAHQTACARVCPCHFGILHLPFH
jgi:hypothetical protein